MNTLIFSLNSTMPVFLLMMLGWVFRQTGLIDEQFARKMNSFVFQIALPVNLFHQLYTSDFYSVWDTEYVLFCFIATLACIGIGLLFSLLLRQKSLRGEFVQASYRSSASLLGIAYIENIYGSATMGPMMLIGCVPLYNIAAVLLLSLLHPRRKGLQKGLMKETVIGAVTNPILLGIVIGFVWSLLKIPMPSIGAKLINSVSALSTPMGLLSMGASVQFRKSTENLFPVLSASFFKLIGFGALMIPIAVALGFRGEKLIAILIMLCSATTVAGYVMAKNMGHKGELTSSVVMVTTFFSSFTLTLWLSILRVLQLI